MTTLCQHGRTLFIDIPINFPKHAHDIIVRREQNPELLF